MNSVEAYVLGLRKEVNACLGGNNLKILKGPSWVMFIVDSDFRDNHKKVIKIAR